MLVQKWMKYKNCHLEFDKKLSDLKRKGYIVPTKDLIKTKEQIEGIRKSSEINNGLLDLISENIKEGITTEEIDKLAYDYTISKG